MKGRGVRENRSGAVLITFSLALVVIFGFMGLAFDLGRLYLARNEAQSFCDAAALAGAILLDGTTPDKALDAVAGTFLGSTGSWKRYHFQNTAFTDVTVKFSKTLASGPYDELGRGADAAGYRFIEVTATASIPMYLSPILTGQTASSAAARAVAAQVKRTYWDEGLAPFAPKGHCIDPATTSNTWGLPPCTGNPDAGLYACDPVQYPNYTQCSPKSFYTLRWEANAWSQSFKKYRPTINDSQWCSGDQLLNDPNYTGTNPPPAGVSTEYYRGTLGYALAEWYISGVKWVDATGFFTTGSVSGASDYRKLIQGAMGAPVELDQILPGFSGTEPQQVSAIKDTLNAKAALGPTRSYIYTPIIDPISGAIVNFGTFELIPNAYGPNNNWCAVYRGKCTWAACTDQVLQDGIYEIRLVR